MPEKACQSMSKLADVGPFVEQAFKASAAEAGFSVDNLDAEQVAQCSKAALQLLKIQKAAQAEAAFEASEACESMAVSVSNVGAADEIELVDDDVACPDLHKVSFSMAYGFFTLRDTKLRLKKDKFYGV